MTTYAVMNLDARYSVSQELVLVFIESWAARFEGELLGFFGSKLMAEHMCRWHESVQQCLEEA